MDSLFHVAEQFKPSGEITDIREYGNGNINDTFLVTLKYGEGRFEACPYIILQRLNTKVFKEPELVMQNMRAVTGHIFRRQKSASPAAGRRWQVPSVLLTQKGEDHWIDSDGSFWRAISFIDSSESFDEIRDIGHAGEVGHALGMFHNLISDLSPENLADTLKGFHITPQYVQHYNEVLAKQGPEKTPETDYCLRFIEERSSRAHVLENAKACGELRIRPIHGDPKVNNFMMDIYDGHAVGIVDLDTVKPGLVHYDIGDCLRSGCNPLGEETELWEKVRFDTDICRAVLKGYLVSAKEFLNDNDYNYIYDAVRLLAFELGLRFFTDYLEGNVYFKASHRSHNLSRALVQFKLTESIESCEKVIDAIIRDLR
ncbi:MAG: aminoglycoside phosphotransferase family protein [Nitrospirota bacterium]